MWSENSLPSLPKDTISTPDDCGVSQNPRRAAASCTRKIRARFRGTSPSLFKADRLNRTANMRNGDAIEFSQRRDQNATRAVPRWASGSARFARTSSVGRTQSIGIELQFGVGQIMRRGPVPRIPPITWICSPVIILPQTRQKRFSSRECQGRN
jgi:hypothetical protein